MESVSIMTTTIVLTISTFFCFGKWPSLGKLVRKLRPGLSLGFMIGWIGWRLASASQQSLLRLYVDYSSQVRETLFEMRYTQDSAVSSSTSSLWNLLLPLIMMRLVHWTWLVMEDFMAWILFGSICRTIYSLYHYSLDEWTAMIIKVRALCVDQN
jgi:hypothetical protein